MPTTLGRRVRSCGFPGILRACGKPSRTMRFWPCRPGPMTRRPGQPWPWRCADTGTTKPPCPLSPHRVDVERVDDRLRVRVLFAAEPDAEREVRRRIDLALSGQWQFPDGFTTPWELRESRSSSVSPDEAEPARQLVEIESLLAAAGIT